MVTAVNDAWARKGKVIGALKENIQSVLDEDTEERLAAVEEALKNEQAKLLSAGNDAAKTDEIGAVIISLRKQKQEILTEAANNTELQERIDDLAAFLDDQTEAITEYSDKLVRRLIERITVYEGMIAVEFKSGLTVEVDA